MSYDVRGAWKCEEKRDVGGGQTDIRRDTNEAFPVPVYCSTGGPKINPPLW